MYRCVKLFALGLALAALPSMSKGQFKDQGGLGGGVGFGGTFGQTDLRDRQSKFMARAFLRYGMAKHIQGELGIGLGELEGTGYRTLLVPIDYRFVLSPLSLESWNPYIYVGIGALHVDVEDAPSNAQAGLKKVFWTGFVPGGVGMQFRIDDRVSFETSGGYNHTFGDKLELIERAKGGLADKDGYWNFLIGLTISGENGDADPDGDGLSNKIEKQLGTDPKNPDSDGDGLNDGEEVNTYSTNPLNADSDGDGLKDGAEVKTYKTNPNKADTDGDGLNDGDEVTKYNTNPLNADSDADGLNDGDEIMKYKTDPLKADTDGDGLSDGDEVMKYKTDPLKVDTDGGTVNDGVEVGRGTNPLQASDDIPPKKEELKVEVGKAIVLDGIVFKTGSAEITAQSEDILSKAFNTLEQNPDIQVEIRGYTDNTGKRAYNMKLSQSRANSVMSYLVKKGIAASRVQAKGFGPDNPIGDNKTADGRQKNRRIEFFRSK